MVAQLRELGVELMVTFWPFANPNSTHYAPFSTAGYLATTDAAYASLTFSQTCR